MPNFDMANFEPLREPLRVIVDSEKNPTFLENTSVLLLKDYPDQDPCNTRLFKKGSLHLIVKCGDYVEVISRSEPTTTKSNRSKDGSEWCCVNVILDYINDMDDEYFAFVKAEDLRTLSDEEFESLYN